MKYLVALTEYAAIGGLVSIFLSAAAAASEQRLDLSLGYAARATYPDTDNDVFAATAGWTWDRPQDGGLRFGIIGGVRNEDFSGDYPAILGAEVLRFFADNALQYGFGARVVWSDDVETSGELAFGAQSFGTRHMLRGTLGLQAFSDDLPIREDTGVFGVGEFTWYGGSNWALRAGIQADTDGTVGALGGEMNIGRSDFSISIEYAPAFDEYRDNDEYDDLTVTIHYVPGYGSLQARDRGTPTRLLGRYVAAQ